MSPRRSVQIPAAMWGLVIAGAAVATYLVGVFSAAVLGLIGIDQGFSRILVWATAARTGADRTRCDHSGCPPAPPRTPEIFDEPASGLEMTVVLTAYNDEASIGEAVDDFPDHPLAKRVLVIDNNSSDATAGVARAHGAIVHTEMKPGYGQCVHRALTEASAYTDTELVALCEGDMTFRAADLDKLAAYSAHAHIVNGTRIVEQLRVRRPN